MLTILYCNRFIIFDFTFRLVELDHKLFRRFWFKKLKKGFTKEKFRKFDLV